MIEDTPQLLQDNVKKALALLTNPDYKDLFGRIDDDYLYWDKVKYLAPEGVDPVLMWHAIKLKRNINLVNISFGDLHFHFTITSKMQQLLHEFDMNFGGTLSSSNIIPEKDHDVYLVSSIMEEAIASSQMEGASTTRKVAKDMLRKQIAPINKSQQMIYNNYRTINYLVEHEQDTFSIDSLLYIHRLMSKNTLDDSSDEGALRKDNKVCVMNSITGEIVHTPPSSDQLEGLLKELCNFANEESPTLFIHPIIKGIIIHFMLAYFHPFVDGNGRTSRSLVYWYLLKKGYWLTEFLSISRVIYKSKPKYERAFIYTEKDGLDLSYFINYNLKAMAQAYEDLKVYLTKKLQEREEFYKYRGYADINERQSQIIRLISNTPNVMLTAKEISTRFQISVKTARTDLQGLVNKQLMMETSINKRMVGYVKSENFDAVLATLHKSKL